MVKICYRCDICQTLYDTEADARKCEDQGTPHRAFDQKSKAGPYEIRSFRLKNINGNHEWVYDVRTEMEEQGIYQYLEFTESELAEYQR